MRRLRRRGSAAIEFALVLLPLTLLLVGIVDYGYAFYAAAQVSNAAREGARAAALGHDGDQSARASLAQARLTRPARVVITPTGTDVGVVIQYDFKPIVGLVPTPAQITGRVVMRREGVP